MARNTPPPSQVLAPSGLGLNWRGGGSLIVSVRPLPSPYPLSLSYVQSPHNPLGLQSAFVRRSSFTLLYVCTDEGWVGGWRKPPPLKVADFTYRHPGGRVG